ncbi:hypothetical protein EV128_12587 [Rhizobium azibense]|nr:hypothetical protein EV128_12587 [Rhizobium azibense]
MKTKEQTWFDAMVEKGHDPILDEDGVIDLYAGEVDDPEEIPHYSPRCKLCYFFVCTFCTGDGPKAISAAIEPCKGDA